MYCDRMVIIMENLIRCTLYFIDINIGCNLPQNYEVKDKTCAYVKLFLFEAYFKIKL